MSLAHGILGLLKEKPMTGYDLKTQRFDKTISHFWSADQAQIYRTLDKLTEQGLLECELEIQEDAPNRKIYHITSAGEEELKNWLSTPQPLPSAREAFQMQIWFGSQLPKETVLDLIEEQLQAYRKRLAYLQTLPIPPLGDPQSTRKNTFCRLTLERGLAIQKANIEWLELCRKIVSEMEN
jgi:DNA-binding PadR family transcriptional regulator